MSAKFEDDRPLSLAEFLAWERRQTERYEYLGNEIRMMVGGTINHARIASNLHFDLRTLLGDRGCETFLESVKVIAADQVHYPDVVMTCSPQEGRETALTDAALIIEVQSPSTADVDRGRKWVNYQTLPSLQAYLMVSQVQIRVDAYIRQHGAWSYVAYTAPDCAISIPALDLSLSVAAIYRSVDFTAGQPP